MAITQKDYNELAVKAAHEVLVEICRILGEYRDNMVIVGGWIPSLIFEKAEEKHVGSIDVDIALNHSAIGEPGYRTILELLKQRGYVEGKQPFSFLRTIVVDDIPVSVEVDLLAGEYEGTGKGHRTQKIQDIHARKARGCDLAFQLQNEITLQSTLPGGALDNVRVQVAGIVPFIVMKGMALHSRIKEKDAYDIYYCIKYFPGGIDHLAEEFKPFLENGLVREGLKNIAERFASPGHSGPVMVADFKEITDSEERELLQRDAFERVHAFSKKNR
jgi:hypothetical protein